MAKKKRDISKWAKQYPVQLNETAKSDLNELQSKVEEQVGLPVKQKDIVAKLIKHGLEKINSGTRIRSSDLESLYTEITTGIQYDDVAQA